MLFFLRVVLLYVAGIRLAWMDGRIAKLTFVGMIELYNLIDYNGRIYFHSFMFLFIEMNYNIYKILNLLSSISFFWRRKLLNNMHFSLEKRVIAKKMHTI